MARCPSCDNEVAYWVYLIGWGSFMRNILRTGYGRFYYCNHCQYEFRVGFISHLSYFIVMMGVTTAIVFLEEKFFSQASSELITAIVLTVTFFLSYLWWRGGARLY